MQILKPNRVVRSYTQRLVAALDEVFPLLCPVREADWIDGWDPVVVMSDTGLAEPDCVFVTADQPGDAVWYITRHESEAGHVEMVRITPSVTACRISIQLRPSEGGSEAVVTYSHTSLGPEGDRFLEGFSEAYYRQFMQDWEANMNHYLTHGEALQSPEG